jgi:outer membrane lipoprotein SlyB
MKNLIIIIAAALALGVNGCATKKAETCAGDSCCATPTKAAKKK